jgi:glyoxylase-like metal-dependent hydrolase (beta-lactamase superfamily II)
MIQPQHHTPLPQPRLNGRDESSRTRRGSSLHLPLGAADEAVAASLPAVSADVAPTDAPVVYEPYAAAEGIDVIPAYLPVPGMGVLPANSYLVHGDEPLLVDCGPGGAANGFRAAVEQVVDPDSIRWLWLTHTDPDHVGALAWLLEAAPDMKVITTFLAAGKLGMHLPVPMDRMHWCNPGEVIEIGDRTLHAIRPPSYDAPETVAAYDARAGVLFSADAFGSLMRAPCAQAGDIAEDDRRDGMALWSSIDAPWVLDVDRDRFRRAVRGLGELAIETVLSAHLPPAAGMTHALLHELQQIPDASPWQAPDQAALEAILSQVSTA